MTVCANLNHQAKRLCWHFYLYIYIYCLSSRCPLLFLISLDNYWKTKHLSDGDGDEIP